MSPLTTHVLDTARGRPAVGVPVLLERQVEGGYERVGGGRTDDDGRVRDLLAPGALQAGVYRITFDLDGYYAGEPSFYPLAQVVFRVVSPEQHHHVPLLLSPFGYSTYRGS